MQTWSHIVPTWQDLDVLQEIDSAISPLSSLTDILSGERYVTVSAVLPMLHILDTDLLKEDITDTELTKDIKHRVVEDIKGHYSKLDDTVNQILQVATYLDPRFKVKYFEHLEESELLCIKQKMIDDAIVCHEVQQNRACTDTQDAEQSSLQPSASKKRNLGTLFKKNETKIREQEEQEHATPVVSQEEQRRQQILKEVEGYLSGDRRDFEEDPLMWWKAPKVCLSYTVYCKLVEVEKFCGFRRLIGDRKTFPAKYFRST